MSAVFDERDKWRDYMRQVELEPIKTGDFSTFYGLIAFCTIIGFLLAALNIYLCCKYRDYWCDSNTGNRWIIPIWTKTPHKQPPLDLTEIDEAWLPPPVTEYEYPDNYSEYEHPPYRSHQEEFIELVQQHKVFQKKESDL